MGTLQLLLGGTGDISALLFVLHGIFIGFTKPLVSGSVDAFYQDAVKREEARGEHQDGYHSFTLSSNFGKYFTTIGIVVAFSLIYVLQQLNMAHHTFLFGIVLWGGALMRLVIDYRVLGDQYSEPSSLSDLFSIFNKRKAIVATFHNLSILAVAVVISFYFIMSIGRELDTRFSEQQLYIFNVFILFCPAWFGGNN